MDIFQIQEKIIAMQQDFNTFFTNMNTQLDELQKIVKNEVEKTPKKTVETIKKIFTFAGKLEPEEEKISVTKKELLDYFSDNSKTKKARTNGGDVRFMIVLEEALLHFTDDHTFAFSKQELSVNKNINSESVSDENAMQLLGKRILKTSAKEDSIEIIKTYILMMNSLELQPNGEDGALPNNCCAIVADWIELNSGKQQSACFSLLSIDDRVWDLGVHDMGSIWPVGRCFLSCPELDNFSFIAFY